MRDFDTDKDFVKSWLYKHCLGFRNARTRKDILPFVQLPDRYFRLIISDLREEGHIYSSADRGYWAAPLHTNDYAEIEAMKHSILEQKAKALSTLQGCDKRLEKLSMMNQGQQVFA